MKPKHSYAWLLWFLFKIPIIRNIARAGANQFEISIHEHIEKMSDEGIEESIVNIKEGGYDWCKEPYASLKAICDYAGVDLEVIPQWLEDEKFLRDHRKKYQEHS